MKIAVCGAQVPFMSGGAELHMDNLVSALRGAHHEVELVRLPTAWDRMRIFDAALAWRLVPIDADLVIATNFPSYFVRHPHKRVWLFHQHRGAYELAGSDLSDMGDDDQALDDQRLLVEWDTRVLAEAERLFTTSATVADRLARYNGLAARTLYHPPPLHDRLHPGPFGRTVFCPTRLERNKRPGLMVEAMSHVTSSDVRLAIAGRGTLRDELAEATVTSGVADRVDLLGFVDDDELVRRYADALAVVYVPQDEDYGYVTLQAFLSGKPVITASDSGGTLEWVVDGETGFVTDGSPEAIGVAIDKLAADPDLASRMGRAGRDRVASLDWPPVVCELLS